MNGDDNRPYADRREGGRVLGARLAPDYANRDDVIVLGLPRGGVPVAFEVAQVLGAPLDLILVRKLGTPGRRELAMGAIASGGSRVLNEGVVRWYGIPAATIEQVVRDEQRELDRREQTYREGTP